MRSGQSLASLAGELGFTASELLFICGGVGERAMEGLEGEGCTCYFHRRKNSHGGDHEKERLSAGEAAYSVPPLIGSV